MAPDQVYITQQLRLIILHLLDSFNYKNAEFACERLLALDTSNLDSIHLQCLTFYHQQRYKRVFNLASDHLDHLGCAYLYARACLRLEKYKEGIYSLLQIDHLYNDTTQSALWFRSSSQRLNYEKKRQLLPDLLTIYHLLGDLHSALGDVKAAAFAYTQALRDNQFDFEAFQKLARLGVDVRVKRIFSSTTNKEDTFNPFAGSPMAEGQLVINLISQMNLTSQMNLSNQGLVHEDDTFGNITPRTNAIRRSNYLNSSSNTNNINSTLQQGQNQDIFPKPTFPEPESKKILKSYSKFTLRLTGSKERQNLKRNSSISHGNGVGDDTTNFLPAQLTLPLEYGVAHGESYLLSLYHVFAKGFKCLCKYDCYKAIRILELLPEHEKNTPWVLAKLGRLHYEIVNYKKLEYFFIKLRQLDRTRLEDMEYYLTLLWHLHKKVELTFLANELYDLDSQLAITWSVIGNLFSLAREPDEAVKCFNRAVKMDPKFTYAYTLKGHEFFSNDNYEMALENFRTLLLIDPRHYNALYGIGMVYINLGDYQKADFHFRKAVLINPINVILICCVGMVLEKTGKRQLALKQYDLANKLQPLNPLPIFKKAQLLFTMQEFTSALEYFEQLKELAPEEALVHFLLGQLYKIQNDKFKAIREFTIALLLDPKGNYLIRDAMESLKN